MPGHALLVDASSKCAQTASAEVGGDGLTTRKEKACAFVRSHQPRSTRLTHIGLLHQPRADVELPIVVYQLLPPLLPDCGGSKVDLQPWART